MRTITALLTAWLLAFSVTSYAVSFGCGYIKIDFTNEKDAQTKATWSKSDIIAVSKDGLGWDGPHSVDRKGWIQTKALALGASWRPTCSISFGVSIQPPPTGIILKNGQKTTSNAGYVFARYSPDRVHWSTWQSLERTEAHPTEDKDKPGWYYRGRIRVPDSEQGEYRKLLSDYRHLDIPWKSDEEAAVQWILEREPDFFSKRLPFVGYVEFLFEARFYGGQRIQSFNVEVQTITDSFVSLPKDEAAFAERDRIPWRFVAKEPAKVEPIVPAKEAPTPAAGR